MLDPSNIIRYTLSANFEQQPKVLDLKLILFMFREIGFLINYSCFEFKDEGSNGYEIRKISFLVRYVVYGND